MLKGVLFDLDDTLIDWSGADYTWGLRERTLLEGVHEYLREQGYSEHDFDMLVDLFMDRTRIAWESARADLRAPNIAVVLMESLEAVGLPVAALDSRACLEAYRWGAAPGCVVFPDVPDALQILVDNDIRVGIVTNAYQPMWLRDRELTVFKLLDYFATCRISAADAGYLKPHPAIFERALACLGTNAAETVFVGDNPVADIAGAQGVGMRAILRVTHPTPPMLSGLIVPDHALNTLAELPDVFDSWFPGWRKS